MRCPQCAQQTLKEQQTPQMVAVDVCSTCHGIWLDRGVIFDFTNRPQELEHAFTDGFRGRRQTQHVCPRCQDTLDRGQLADRDAEAEICPTCGGLWFESAQLDRAVKASGDYELSLAVPEVDTEARARAQDRVRDLAAGMLALPNLLIRSVFTLTLLYGLLIAGLIAAVEFGGVNESVVLVIGIAIALVQFVCGPWFMDFILRWIYKFHWMERDELPEHLEAFVARVCEQEKMKFPTFGLIEDRAPTAFTYGHTPNNARIIISQGILDLLEPEEVEAVVAHEMGHAKNWDMVLMTIAHLVPLLLYWIYRIAIRFSGGRDKDGGYGWLVAMGAYTLYIVSEYIVLWFSRTREFFADRFAGRVTNNPNGVAMALVKIAYGLAAQGQRAAVPAEKASSKSKNEAKTEESASDSMKALNNFDKKSALSLVMASSSGDEDGSKGPDVENIKSAMQWDLWNPWAKWYELQSTHPLVARRLMYLGDQAAHLGQDPLVLFDRRQPESYWDDFALDVAIMCLPWMGFLIGLGVAAALGHPVGFGIAIVLAGVGSLVKTNFSYRRDFFPHLSIAALLHKVKVSAVRPVPTTLTGKIIGKGVPGLIWSEDFVLKDRTGILFMDYKQPLAIWNFLFGLLRADRYQDKEVRVTGWFRRAPVPYLEVNRIDVLDESEPPRRCYSLLARQVLGGLMVAAGLAAMIFTLVAR